MAKFNKFTKIAKITGFNTHYAVLVFIILIVYAAIEGLFSHAVSKVNIQEILTNNGSDSNLTFIFLFFIKVIMQGIATFTLVKFGFYSANKYQSYILSILPNKTNLLFDEENKVAVKRYLLNEPLNVANLISIPAMLLVSEILVVVTLGVTIIFSIDNGLFVIIAQIGILILGFVYVSRKLTTKWGKLRQHYEGKRIQRINALIDNYYFVVGNGFSDKMQNSIQVDTVNQFSFNANQGFIDKVPRIFLELSIVFVLVLSAKTFSTTNNYTEDLYGQLGLLGYVGYRIFPATNRILMSMQSINFALQGINESDLVRSSKHNIKHIFTNKITATNQLLNVPEGTLKLGEEQLLKWENMYIDGEQSRLVNVVGENGAGKSLFMKAVTGSFDKAAKPTSMAIVSQELGNLPYSLSELDSNVNIIDKPHDFGSQLKNTLLSNLSGGQRQKSLLNFFMKSNKQIIFLDEPSSALDTESKAELWTLLEQTLNQYQNMWIVVVTHDPIPSTIQRHTLTIRNRHVNHR